MVKLLHVQKLNKSYKKSANVRWKMKTKQEIEKKLKIYEQIKDNSCIFTSEFNLSIGAITALKWVLEIDEVEK